VLIGLGIGDITIKENYIDASILERVGDGQILDLKVKAVDLYSPTIDDAEIAVNLRLGKAKIYYPPESINKAIRFFRNVKSSRNDDIESFQA